MNRNERDTAMARMAQRLTNEGNVFLGEKIIEVRRVGPPQEVWYKLGELYNVIATRVGTVLTDRVSKNCCVTLKTLGWVASLMH